MLDIDKTIEHSACPCGISSDAFTINFDKDDKLLGGYCHSGNCQRENKSFKPSELDGYDHTAAPVKKERKLDPIPDVEYRALTKRGIDQDVAKQYGIGTCLDFEGSPAYILSYYKGNQLVGAKVRYASRKEFKWLQYEQDQAGLFGQQCFAPGGKYITLTEGEFDAAAAYQMMGKKWPVVSVRSSTDLRAVFTEYEYLNSFDNIVICFDNDTAGQKAADTVAKRFAGKAKIVSLQQFKDANDYLLAKKSLDFMKEWWNASPVKDDTVVFGTEMLLEIAKEKPPVGIPLIWPKLTEITRGVRHHEVWTFGGGTSLGKSEVLKRLAYGIMSMHNKRVGMIMLEETHPRTVQCLLGQDLKTRFYLENARQPTNKQLQDAAERLGPFLAVDKDQQSEWTEVKSKIEYMVRALGCEYIFLDHLTAIAEGKGRDVNSELHKIMEDLNNMVVKDPFSVFCISHLNQSANKNHEEGARVTLRDFYGSGAIKQRSNFVFGFEGDLHGEVIPKNRRILRCLKDRNAGDGGGEFVSLEYDTEEGTLNETEDLDAELFKEVA